jgi:cobalt-zinc-cadmium efflux system membrane fusion protein
MINQVLYFAIISYTLFACSIKNTDEKEKEVSVNDSAIEITKSQFQTADIKIGVIEDRVLNRVLKVNGKLDVPPQNLVSVSAPFGGFLQATEMLQGKRVRKGQQIAVIQNPDYIQLQQDYLTSKSQLEYLESEFKRQEALSKENVNALKDLQRAKAAYFSGVASEQGLRAKLKLLNVDFASLERGEITSTINLYSPIGGYITEVNFNIGSFVNPTDVLFKIVDTNHLHAELTVFEKDATKIKEGQKVRFLLAGSSTERTATVYLIGREISADRTVRIHCHLDNEETNLLPGMYLSAEIALEHIQVGVLPANAIVSFEGKPYIFIMRTPNQFTIVEVKTGLHDQGFTEVILPENLDKSTAQVVINGAYSLLSKMKNSADED